MKITRSGNERTCSLVVALAALLTPSAAHAGEPPSCRVAIGSTTRAATIPANAPFVPIVDQSIGVQPASVVAQPLGATGFVADPIEVRLDARDLMLRLEPSASLPEGEHTLDVGFTCPVDGTHVDVTGTIDVVAASELPSGSLGVVSEVAGGHAIRIELAPNSAAYQDLSTFEIAYSANGKSLFSTSALGVLVPRGQALVAGFATERDPGVDGIDLRTTTTLAANACAAGSSTATIDLKVLQRVPGKATENGGVQADATAASATASGSVTIDCADVPPPPSADPGEKDAGILACSLGSLAATKRAPGAGLAALVVAGIAVARRRRKTLAR